MATYEEIKAKAKLATKAVPLCLRGDLQAEHEQLERELRLLKDVESRGGTLSGSSEERKVVEEKMAALREQMQESTQTFTLRALTHRRFSDLKAAHRPRRDHEEDARLGWNGDTFPVALVQACLIDPALTLVEVEDLVDTVFTQGQWDKLFVDALYLNAVAVDIPS